MHKAISLQTKGLLFDMDGTLVESNSDVEKIWAAWCEARNIDLASVLAICHGVRSQDTIQKIAPHLDLAEELALLEKLEIELTVTANSIENAKKVLESLNPQSWALVTSASKLVAEHRMRLSNLPLPQFAVFSEDVTRGKPNPEPYLLGAQRLGLAAEDCIAFEDAPAGIKSAQAAGCKVIQIGGTEPLVAGVSAVIPHFSDLTISWNAEQACYDLLINRTTD